MIISDPKQFVFIHNPKAAGTSIRRALFQHDTNEYAYEYQRYVPMLDRVIELFHVCAADMLAVWPDVVENWSRYFSFGFVRNPYDRLFSSWDEYRRQHPEMASADFNYWARLRLQRANVRYDWEFTHFCPQHYFFYNGRKCVADFIGRHENLEQDWETACRLAKIPYTPLGHEKEHGKYKLPNRLEMADIDEDVLTIINGIYEMDFVYFGYEMRGKLPERARHLDVIERNTHPHQYCPDRDIRLMSVPEQCAYWRDEAHYHYKRAEALQELRREAAATKNETS